MFAKRILYLLFFVMSSVESEVLQALSSGMGYIQSKAVMIPYVLGVIPKTAIHLYGMNYFNTSITLCDSLDNIIFTYIGMQKFTHYSVSIATIEGGYRIFDNGEEVYFQSADIKSTAKVYISEPGLSTALITRNDPPWVFYEDAYLMGHDYSVNGGLSVPVSFNLTLDNGNTFSFGDYLMFNGEIGNLTTLIQIQLKSPTDTVLDLILRLDGEPFMKISSVHNGVEQYQDTSSKQSVLEKSRFTIHLVCEHQGWRIYVNGLDFHYFYHRLPIHNIQTAVLKGNDWKIRKFTQKYSENTNNV